MVSQHVDLELTLLMPGFQEINKLEQKLTLNKLPRTI